MSQSPPSPQSPPPPQTPPPLPSPPETPTLGKTIPETATQDNSDPKYYAITPKTEETAWGVLFQYNPLSKDYISHDLCLLQKASGNRFVSLDYHIANSEESECGNIRRLCAHPVTGELFGTFDDKTVRRFCFLKDKTKFRTVVCVQCEFEPGGLAITCDGDFIVGELWRSSGFIHWFNADGTHIRKSRSTFKAHDIAFCTIKRQVALACRSRGLVIVDDDLIKEVLNFNLRVKSGTVDFDQKGNLIIGDWNNKEICVLDKDTYEPLHRMRVPQMSKPCYLRAIKNSLWVVCSEPSKLLHMPYMSSSVLQQYV